MRVALGLVATAAAVGLLAPSAVATPESDASDAITAAWEAGGGDESELGARQGDTYPIGEGFAEDFAGGKMFYTPATGAHALYGAVLQKYESLGGPADSDVGFPTVDEAPGLVSPDSRSVIFSADDKPVIFYTPDHGAFVVRGAINAAWDKLGSSSGALGVPIADETTDGGVITQRFSAGQLSWNTATKAFSTDPPDLAAQLKDLQIPVDATAAINRTWRAEGGAGGPLGAKHGEQYAVGADGAGQDFSGGKIFFSPATGANAIDGDVLAKYESLGGPAGSDLGFPVANEADGPIPGSRVSTFSGEGKPVIFSAPDHGAFVVRGALKTAWDKLGAATGALGAPLGDQTVDGNVVSQKFSGGQISWDRVANRFTTDPESLASQLVGLQVPGQDTPSVSASGHHADGGFTWHWWWLAVALGVLVLLAVLAAWWGMRRRTAGRLLKRRGQRGRSSPAPAVDDTAPVTDADDEEHWSGDADEAGATVRLSNFPGRYDEPPAGMDLLDQSEPDDSWMPGGGAAAGLGAAGFTEAHPDEGPSGGDDDYDDENYEEGFDEDPDAVDTAPTGIPTVEAAYSGRHAALGAEADDAPEPAEHTSTARPTAAQPAFRLALGDPYQAPDGYPVKANTASGLYYTPGSALYQDTLAEIWFANEEVAQFNGFISAD